MANVKKNVSIPNVKMMEMIAKTIVLMTVNENELGMENVMIIVI